MQFNLLEKSRLVFHQDLFATGAQPSMLKRKSTAYSVFRAFNSTLQVEYSAAEALGVETSSLTKQDNMQKLRAPAIGLNKHVITVRDKLSGLENDTSVLETKASWSRPIRDDSATNSLRECLRTKQYTKLLINMMVQEHLNGNYISSLFAKGLLTKSEYSTFVNRLLVEKGLNEKLSNVIPDTVHTEILFRLFEVYCNYAVEASQDRLTPLQSHDINMFVKRFIDETQLGKAQKCLQYILDKQSLQFILQSGDTETIINFLKLRCGAIPKFWKVNHSAKPLGQDSINFKSPKSFKMLKEQPYFDVMNALLKDKYWNERSSTALDSTVIYSLGYMGRTELLESYIQSKWGITQDGYVGVSNKAAPESEILIAILSSYCMKGDEINKGLKILDQFTKKYPDIVLENLFWRRLLQMSFKLWDREKDRKAQVCHGCWNTMKKWHEQKGLHMTYDHGVLEELYKIFKLTNYGQGSMEVISRCFPFLYSKQPNGIPTGAIDLLLKFQKLALKTMAAKGSYHKPLQFIKQWNLDKVNQQNLLSYFMGQRRKYDLRQERIRSKKNTLQIQYDAMEEEDMLLGRLW